MKRFANIAVMLLLFGCGHGSANQGKAIEPPPVQPLPLVAEGGDCCRSCPVALEGVKVDYAESGGGAVMLFTTADKTNEEELRRRVNELAALHNRDEHKLAMITLPHRAEVQPIDGGARLDLVPRAFNDTQTFRTEVEREVQWMREGHCPPLGQENECASCDLVKR